MINIAFEDHEVYSMIITPTIVGLIEIAKRLGFPAKYTPILALILGLLAAAVYLSPGEPKKFILKGIITGLSASGTYYILKKYHLKNKLT